MKTSIHILSAFIFLVTVQAKILNNEIPMKSSNLPEITWKEVYSSSVRCFAANSKGHLFAGTWGVLRSEDNGDNWILVELPNETWEVNSIAINSNDDIFATTYGGKLYRSTNDGNNWTQLHTDSTHISFNCIDINSSGAIFIGTDNGVLRSINNGYNLEKTGWNNSVDNLAISPGDDIFITSYGVYRSIDNGDNWTETSSGLTNTGVNDFAFNSLGHILVGTAADNGGVFTSTDNGDNWTITGYSFQSETDSVVIALAINSTDDIFIGTFGIGVVCSMDNGNSWTEINSGFPRDQYFGYYPIVQSFIFNTEGYILAGTSNGIFRSEQIVTTSTEADDYIPKSFLLEQNFPNPFNPSTIIKFTLSKTEYVNIEVFNALGQKIKTLLNKHMIAGHHEVEFTAGNLSSGIYFYRIEAGEFQEVKKMVLLK